MLFALNSLLVTFRYNDMGTIVIGKVESGGAKKGETLLIMPNKVGIGLPATSLIYLLLFPRWKSKWSSSGLTIWMSPL